MEFLLIFAVGLAFGSFLNVVISRLKTRQNIVFGGSFCPECKTPLRWYDLIPLLSFIYLRGRCCYCHKKISWQYPIVELISGLLWVLIFYNFGISLINIYYIFIFSALLVIAVYDFKWQIIPDKIVYPAIVIAFVYNALNATFLIVASSAFLFFFLIYFFSKGYAMGLGDAKLAFLIGLFLSPLSAATTFILAFVLGAASGIMLIVLGQIFPDYRKWGMKSQIAFGPFLVLGVFIAFFFSDFINNFLIF